MNILKVYSAKEDQSELYHIGTRHGVETTEQRVDRGYQRRDNDREDSVQTDYDANSRTCQKNTLL